MRQDREGIDWEMVALDLADELGPCSRVCPNVYGEDCTECWLEWAIQKLPCWERPNLEELHKEDKQ